MKNEARRKISVTLPDLLVTELDTLASSFNRSRSEFIALALKRYINETRKTELKEQLKKGYLEMGDLNLSIAEESLLSDEHAYEIYEEFLEKNRK
jgi:CopG family transcriptional regulator/antitoxin EndoAI